jgi:rhamnosyltransferase subunit B
MQKPKILLATIGSLGDLHPFIAIALALQQRGFHPVIAVSEDHAAKCRAAGLETISIMPSFEAVIAHTGLAADEIIKRLMEDQSFVLEKIVFPPLAAIAALLDEAAAGAVAIVGSMLTLAAPIIAEKHRIPFIAAVLQPMAMFSACDPPQTPDFFRIMKAGPTGALGTGWNRFIYGVLHRAFRHRYAARIDAVRATHGLAPSNTAILLDHEHPPALTLGCYSPAFAPAPPDAPAHTAMVGFPVFDSGGGLPEALDHGLEAFLNAGPAPLVFTLGSAIVYAAGDFYVHAAQAAARLGMRAVLLTGQPDGERRSSGDVLVRAYVPHSALFPRAAAIIHHGGVGTTGQALRAGRPQLVVPHMLDQFDNARRIQRIGVGDRLAAKRLTPDRVQAKLTRLLAHKAYQAQAARIGAIVQSETGAQTAALAIEEAIARHGRVPEICS